MNSSAGYEQIAKSFKDAATLPQMPTAALKLNQLLESDNASPLEIEQAVIHDTALTAALLRTSTAAIYGRSDQPVTTVRTAIMRLGSKAVKATSLSLWTQALVSQTQGRSKLSAARFTDHSTFVGYLARYLFSCRMNRERFATSWSPDEIMAAGVLHDLGIALLAVVEPISFDRVFNQAAVRNVPFSVKFLDIFGRSVADLGVAAVTAWGLDPLFGAVIGCLDDPQSHPNESIAIACVHYADRIAGQNKYGLFPFPVEPICAFAEEEVGLPPEEVAKVVSLVAETMKEHEPKKRNAA
jgi:HD-like signal output (HDOD) protein